MHTVAYGTEIVKMMGNDLQSWNMEVMDMANSAMFAFWPVDYLPIRKSVSLQVSFSAQLFPQSALYRAGFLELHSSMALISLRYDTYSDFK